MTARCPRCGTTFAVNGPGRYTCPGCGVTNEVRGGPGDVPPAGPPPGSTMPPPPPPPPPEPPSQRKTCPECSFTFIVGQIALATCPMCDAEVPTGLQDEEPS